MDIEKEIKEAREWLKHIMSEDFNNNDIETVAEKYGLNKTDRVTIPEGNFDGKFSKVVEIVLQKGGTLNKLFSAESNNNSSCNCEDSKLKIEEITENFQIEKQNIINSYEDEIKTLKNEIELLKTPQDKNNTVVTSPTTPTRKWGNTAGVYKSGSHI